MAINIGIVLFPDLTNRNSAIPTWLYHRYLIPLPSYHQEWYPNFAEDYKPRFPCQILTSVFSPSFIISPALAILSMFLATFRWLANILLTYSNLSTCFKDSPFTNNMLKYSVFVFSLRKIVFCIGLQWHCTTNKGTLRSNANTLHYLTA